VKVGINGYVSLFYDFLMLFCCPQFVAQCRWCLVSVRDNFFSKATGLKRILTGRIGRIVFRNAIEAQGVDVVAINE